MSEMSASSPTKAQVSIRVTLVLMLSGFSFTGNVAGTAARASLLLKADPARLSAHASTRSIEQGAFVPPIRAPGRLANPLTRPARRVHASDAGKDTGPE